MTRPKNIAVHFDKTRRALLCLVGAWLMFAGWFASKPNRKLPRRLSLFVDSHVCKAELAAFYLRVAAGHAELKNASTLEDLAYKELLTIGRIIARLKAIIIAVRSLRFVPKTRTKPPVAVTMLFDGFAAFSYASPNDVRLWLPP